MITKKNAEPGEKKFLGIPVPADLTTAHFFSLYTATLVIACLMALPAVLQPAYLKEIINIPKDQAGSINSGLQNMSQIATLFFVGLFGILSDKIGRKVLIVLGFIVCSIFFIVFGYTKEISMIMGIEKVGGQIVIAYSIRFVIGIGIVLCFPQTITMCADYVSPRNRGKAFAMHGAMVGLGSLLVFMVLAQIARMTGLISLFYMSGGLGLIGFVITRRGVTDRLPKQKAASVGFRVIFTEVAKSFPIRVGYVVTLLTRADIVILATFIILWMVYKADAVGITPVKATATGGIIMGVMSIVTLFAYPVLGVLADRWGRVPLTIAGLFVGGGGLCLMAATENPFSSVMFIYPCLICVGFSGAALASGAMTADASPKKLLGSIMGGLNTMQPIGILIFLQVGGLLFDKVGYWAPFAFKGAANLLCGLWILAMKKKIVMPEQEGSQD